MCGVSAVVSGADGLPVGDLTAGRSPALVSVLRRFYSNYTGLQAGRHGCHLHSALLAWL